MTARPDENLPIEDARVDSEPPRRRHRSAVAAGAAVAIVAALIAVTLSRSSSPAGDTGPAATAAPTTTAPTTTPYLVPDWLPAGMAVQGAIDVTTIPANARCVTLGPTTTDRETCTSPLWSQFYAADGASLSISASRLRLGEVPNGAVVEVRGRTGGLSNPGPDPTFLRLVWIEGSYALSIATSGLARDDLLRIANGLRAISESEWRTFVNNAQPRPITPPELAAATELARTTAPWGAAMRLMRMPSGALCFVEGEGLCLPLNRGPALPPGTRAALANASSRDSRTLLVLVVEAELPDVSVETDAGVQLPSARGTGTRYLFVADHTGAASYRLVDAGGALLATVAGPGARVTPTATSTTAR